MDSNKLILEAIALKKCLTAVYNTTRFKLAPHILYTRHDELYIDGVALEREGLPPRELKLGTFKVSGMKDVEVDSSGFEIQAMFDPGDERYIGQTLFAVSA